jgi:hypothetical protein
MNQHHKRAEKAVVEFAGRSTVQVTPAAKGVPERFFEGQFLLFAFLFPSFAVFACSAFFAT